MILRAHRNPCLTCMCSLYLIEERNRVSRIEFISAEFSPGHLSCMEIYLKLYDGKPGPVRRVGNVVYLFCPGNEARRKALVYYCDSDARQVLGEVHTKHGTLKSAIRYARDASLVDSHIMYQAFKFLADKIIYEDMRYIFQGADEALVESGLIKNLGLVE